ncbi:urea transporter [Neobacillus sp. GCM10023253]|uniref:urea transporter n=1 Tax=Neobacillus sp. GCM10023253 TaxID=3252644 RepID=UPI00361ADB82
MKTDVPKSLKGGKFYPFLRASLKGISQVILIENSITGLLILIAIAISSIYLGVIALLSAMIGTFTAMLGGADKESIDQGLLGYNSVLTGMALALFLQGPYMWTVALAGAVVAAVLTAAMMHFMKNTKVPILTFPFIVLTWLMLLAAYKLKHLSLSASLVPQDLANWQLNIAGKVNLLDGVFHGIGQVFFLNNTWSGILVLIAVFWGSRKLGMYAAIGNAAAIIIAYVLGGEHSLIVLGLYGYNAILTIIAVSGVFNEKHNRYNLPSGILAACLTVPITAGLSTWLLPYGLPALTMPFVLSTWLILGARKTMPNL